MPFPLTYLPWVELIGLERFNQLEISQFVTYSDDVPEPYTPGHEHDREGTRGLSENHHDNIMVLDPPIRHGLNNFNVLNDNKRNHLSLPIVQDGTEEWSNDPR